MVSSFTSVYRKTCKRCYFVSIIYKFHYFLCMNIAIHVVVTHKAYKFLIGKSPNNIHIQFDNVINSQVLLHW